MAVSESDSVFGGRLRAAREAKGWSLEEAGKRAQVARSTLANYETGIRPLPLSAARRLAELYGLDVGSEPSSSVESAPGSFADGVRWGRVVSAQAHIREALDLIDEAIPATVALTIKNGRGVAAGKAKRPTAKKLRDPVGAAARSRKNRRKAKAGGTDAAEG